MIASRAAIAVGTLLLGGCSALVDTRDLVGKEEPRGTVAGGGRPTDEPAPNVSLRDETPNEPKPEDSNDPGALLDDEFESALDCDGWRATWGTAEPAPGGYNSPRACLICRSGDIYVDKVVPLPASGTVIFEARAKRTTAVESTPFHLHQIFHTEGSDSIVVDVAHAQLALTDQWTNLKVIHVARSDVDTLRLRIRVESGCVLVDDVRVHVTPP